MDVVGTKLEEIQNLLNQSLDYIFDCAENLEECGEGEKVNELKARLKDIIRSKHHLSNFKALYGSILTQVRNTSTEHSSQSEQEHINRLEKAAHTIPSIRWSNCPEYNEFKSRVWEVNHREGEPPVTRSLGGSDNDEREGTKSLILPSSVASDKSSAGEDNDEDLIIATTRQTTICPLTQTTFINPVYNPDCGHTYSREAIRQLARGRATIPCPVMGCSATVTLGRLQINREMDRRINRVNRVRIFK